ncbi:MAG: hypothetical protein DRI44_08270, partial [Chlamydiae bacterium]
MNQNYNVNATATESAFGGLETDAAAYHPLETVTIRIKARARGDSQCTIRVCDPEQHPYFEETVTLDRGRGKIRFRAGGLLGTHYVYLIWQGEQRHSRYVNFRLDGNTHIASGDPDIDDLYPLTREAMLRGRREYSMPAGCFVGYISADTAHFDGIWLRDS